MRIWFSLWPEAVAELTADGEDRQQRLTFFQMNGRFRLAEIPDRAHEFLYGHRFWVKVKKQLDPATGGTRWERIEAAALSSQSPPDFAYAMAAIAQMTFEQCGAEFLSSGYQPDADALLPADWLSRRATGLKTSILEYFLGKKSIERVIYDERQGDGWFPILPQQEITGAAEMDKRAFHEHDPRCYEGMGVIPVDCRAGSCGTCWIGVLGGNGNLDPMEEFERKRLEYFGYLDSGFVMADVPRPLIRLACQVRANGSVSIVIPPWNGVFGRSRREKESQS